MDGGKVEDVKYVIQLITDFPMTRKMTGEVWIGYCPELQIT